MTWFVVTLFQIFSRTLAWIGPRRSIALGRALGLFVFYCLPIRRRLVIENLARAFPEKSEKERWRIARDCYRQLGRVMAEVVFMPSLSDEEISRLVRLRNAHLLESSIADGKGVIFCMAHMGNWELIGFEGHRRGYLMYGITKALKGAVNLQLHAIRKKLFTELPPKDSFEQGIQALAKGAVLALIIDQHRAGNKAVVVDFFGRPAATSPSPALFQLRSNAPVVTGWMRLGEDDVYEICCRGPYAVPEAATLAERLQLHTQWLARDLEDFIRANPAEWFWIHRRWKVADSTPVPLKDAALPPMPPIPGRHDQVVA